MKGLPDEASAGVTAAAAAAAAVTVAVAAAAVATVAAAMRGGIVVGVLEGRS